MSRQSRKIFTRRKKTPDKSRRRAKPPESTLEFEHNESNILPSILKTDFLERSIIKFLPNENSRRHLSPGRVLPCMPSAASLCCATSRRARAFFLALTLPQHPRPPDFDAIYEKFVFSRLGRGTRLISPGQVFDGGRPIALPRRQCGAGGDDRPTDGLSHPKPPRLDEGDGGARGAVFTRERAARGGIPRLVVACGRGAI